MSSSCPAARVLLTSFLISCFLAALAFAASELVAETYHPHLLLGCAGLLLLGLLGYSAANPRFLTLLAAATGLAWGFLSTISMLVSLQNDRDSVAWERMVPALVLIPLCAVVLVLPVWLLARRARKRSAAGKRSDG